MSTSAHTHARTHLHAQLEISAEMHPLHPVERGRWRLWSQARDLDLLDLMLDASDGEGWSRRVQSLDVLHSALCKL